LDKVGARAGKQKIGFMSELRFHPFLDQWVITATQRQDRTFLPPDDYCPLCPTKPGGFPTEIPQDHYDIVVFQNKFPSLSLHPPEPGVSGSVLTPVRPSHGVCEVVCYSQVHDSTFATLPYSQARKLTRVWKERYQELGAVEEVAYVFIFENKGKEIGVTLSHPHGQIYAYPFIPPTAKIELDSEERHFQLTGRPLMESVLLEHGVNGGQLPEGRTSSVIYENDRFVAFIPFFARYPYETYVVPKRHLRSLAEMDAETLDDLADALLSLTRKFDGLFDFSLPYIMAMHQKPTLDGFDSNWFHVEFYPPYRTAKKLKYLAGSEAGAGAFINDTLPEETVQNLLDVKIALVR
jgi:UDPglucose--hexose-1-phosphate uridylyltransferase